MRRAAAASRIELLQATDESSPIARFVSRRGEGMHHVTLEVPDLAASLAGLRQPVDKFFDDVLVMAEEPQLRANRLGLLQQTLSLFYRIADISKLGGTA